MATVTPTSIQEAATKFVNEILGGLNSAATEIAGVDVMWFRLVPDKRSQDVIFQSYTLFGVEDCPLSFKAMYSDSGYDDAAITYNIMGINFAVPMTMDIAVDTWKTATGNDGTIPQKGDIVYIPMTKKLMEVVSMQPVKQLGGQLTSYKVNLSIYTPTRSRIVGEQLKESIENNTTNLMDSFGEDIHENIEDIVDDNQLSKYSSTSQDKQKKVTPERSDESIMLNVKSIEMFDLIIDGHTVARNYYNLNKKVKKIVEYKKNDHITPEDERCFTCWFNIHEPKNNYIKNIKKGISVYKESGEYYLDVSVGSKFKENEPIKLQRGSITIPGTVVNKNRIHVNGDQIVKLNKTVKGWNNLPGYTITSDNILNLLTSNSLSLSIKGMSLVSISTTDEETLVQLTEEIQTDKWYGIIINMSDKFEVNLFTQVNGKLTQMSSSSVENEIYDEIDVEKYYIIPSNAYMTNIRLYDCINDNIDKQLTELVSYNIRNDHHAIINDSADTYLNQKYIGRQR